MDADDGVLDVNRGEHKRLMTPGDGAPLDESSAPPVEGSVLRVAEVGTQ